MDDNTVFRGLLDLGDNNGALVAVAAVELEEIGEGVIANDVGVEDEEGGVVLEEDLLGEFEGTSSVEGFGLDGEFDVDVVLFLVLG